MREHLEEAARSVGKVDWSEFVEAISESWKRVHEEQRSLSWVRGFSKAETQWAESCGKPPMTAEERMQACFNYVMEKSDVAQDEGG